MGVIIIPYQQLCHASVESVNDKMMDLALEAVGLNFHFCSQPVDLPAVMMKQLGFLFENQKAFHTSEKYWCDAKHK
jgi:hypothetical protein